MKQSLNERLEKSNTTAGKLSEALGYIDAQAAQIAQLREALEKAANELWDKHFKAAKAEWATDDVARKYADAIVDEYRTAARALKGGE